MDVNGSIKKLKYLLKQGLTLTILWIFMFVLVSVALIQFSISLGPHGIKKIRLDEQYYYTFQIYGMVWNDGGTHINLYRKNLLLKDEKLAHLDWYKEGDKIEIQLKEIKEGQFYRLIFKSDGIMKLDTVFQSNIFVELGKSYWTKE